MTDLLRPFQARTAGVDAYVRLNQFLDTAPQPDIDAWALAALAGASHGGTFLDQTWSYVSREALAQAVEQGVATLQAGQTSAAAESVLAHASLQFPADLQRHLPRLFQLRPNAHTYYENWPWRCAAESDVSFLRSALLSPQIELRLKAWLCLLETRQPEAMAVALGSADQVRLRHPVMGHLLDVGHCTPQQPLHTTACAHFSFAPGFLPDDGPAWRSRWQHPTWHLPADDGPTYRFGGTGAGRCGLCGHALHHLVSLPASQTFGTPGDARTVPLEVCLSCLGWERDTLFYRHTDGGVVECLGTGSAAPEFVAEPLQETRVRLTPTPPRWTWQDWGLSNARENLHRVGGPPCWVQSAHYPDCPHCGATMHFLLQLDSELPTKSGGSWLWGSGGVGYAFTCKPCRITAFLWQCT